MRTGCLVVAVVTLMSCGDHQLPETLYPIPSNAEKRMPAPPAPAVATITKLSGPESVLHDPEQDVYFISNMNGGLTDIDGNGFVSRIDAATMSVEMRWIESGRGGVRLDAPKGMAVVGDVLYIADVTAVRKFDRKTGRPLGAVRLPATLINDLTTDGTSVYVSDTGIAPGPGITFRATGTDAIWKISNDRAERIASSRELGQPNGIDFHDGRLRIATFAGREVYTLDNGAKKSALLFPRGQLDGLAHLDDGSAIVASWLGTAVYRSKADGVSLPILTAIAAPADISIDRRRGLLLVPNTPMNQVTIHALPK